MLIRIVRMTFHPDTLGDFLVLFDTSAPRIRTFPGCLYLELWQDVRFPNLLTTHSHWRTPKALECYRNSDLFREVWAKARPLFAAPPEAFSHYALRQVASGEHGTGE